MNFSVVLIAKNEVKTLPRLVESLSEFQKKGGKILLLDTGSTDGTPEIARSLGCEVHEVGEKFIRRVTQAEADTINNYWLDSSEEPIFVNGKDKLFDYSAARNYIAEFAPTDMIATPDCDEVYTKLDLKKIQQAIRDGVEQLEYNFVFSHDQFGNEAIKFLHCKFYNRKKLHWEGIIHEVLVGNAKRQFFDESVIKLEHWQNPEQNRGHYLKGLALDCYLHPNNDRNSHYFGRELLWTGRPKSAIKELKRHIEMNKWPAERSQSMLYIGDAYRMLNDEQEALNWYFKAYLVEPNRREPLMRLAEYFYRKGNAREAITFALPALEIPETGFYADNHAHYTHYPHEILYWAYWQLGDKEKSAQHFSKAFAFAPLSDKYLYDLRFYAPLPKVSFIIPQLGREEGLKKCLDSIKNLNYPQELIETIVEYGLETVPVKVANGLKKATGDVIVYAANDTEFTPNSLILAVLKSGEFGLVAFNTGEVLPDEGNICEHFLIQRGLIKQLGGQIFDTDFHHVGVDNLLWAKAKKLGQAYRCGEAVVIHNHFSTIGKMDEIYEKGWSEVKTDRALLKQKLSVV